ncbi:hypothetical protein ACFV19_14930 [Streptomyces griseoluteus]|uniref:hypothetical protein n=1 Tax=Streptomyces griseoluteus TaxID=29306 RepID=UPI00369C67EC
MGAELQMPYVSTSAETSFRVPIMPPVRTGALRADEARDFRHEMCTVLSRASVDTVLTCLRDLDVLDELVDACVGIAPDVALLAQDSTVVAWRLTDPALGFLCLLRDVPTRRRDPAALASRAAQPGHADCAPR